MEAALGVRVSTYWVDAGSDVHIMAAVIYGVQDGDKSDLAAQTTDAIVEAAKDVFMHHPHAPNMLLGDLNAVLQRLPEIAELWLHHGWVDEAKDAGGTCITSNSHIMTRRDYMLACPLAHQLVVQTKISYTNTFATHNIVQARIRARQALQSVDTLHTHRSPSRMRWKGRSKVWSRTSVRTANAKRRRGRKSS